MTDIELQQYWNTTQEDIIYGILEAVGGGMNDIEQLFLNVTNDILYAVLKKLREGSGGQNFANTDLTFTGDRTHDLNNFSLWLKGGHDDAIGRSNLTLSLFYIMLLHANEIAINADDNIELNAPDVNIKGFINWYIKEGNKNVDYGSFGKKNDETTKEPFLRLIQHFSDNIVGGIPRTYTDFFCEYLEIQNIEFGIKTRLNFPTLLPSQVSHNNYNLIDGVYCATLATEELINSISNQIELDRGTTSYLVPAGKILKAIWFQGGSSANIGVGLSSGTNDLCDPGDLANGGDLVVEGLKPFRNETIIYLNGVQSDTVTIIYLL